MNLLEPLRAFLRSRSVRAYLVGGAVRDLLLQRETHDLDISVRGSASNLARAFADDIGGSYFLMDETFDVARVILDRADTRDIVDFARMRGNEIQDDLGSRDFTINAMAVDAAEWDGDASALIDPFNGLVDIHARCIRAVTGSVFLNDAVRLLRAVRLEAELDFAMDDTTGARVRTDAPLIENAPMERVRDEFIKILAADHVLRNLRRLDALDLLGRVLPELNAMRGVTQSPPHIYNVFEHSLYAAAAAEEMENAEYQNLALGAFGAQLRGHFSQAISGGRTRRELLRLVLLLHDVGKPATRTLQEDGRIRYFGHEDVGADMVEGALRRLKFSNEETSLSEAIVRHHLRPLLLAQNGMGDRAIHRFFRDTGQIGVDIAVHAWCDQHATYGENVESEETAALQAVIGRLLDRFYHAHAQVVAPPALLNGSDVMQILQIPPGKRIGELLNELREAQAVGEVTTRDQAVEFITRSQTAQKI